MPVIRINLESNQLSELVKAAGEADMDVETFVKGLLPITKINELSLAEVIEKALALSPESEFTLSELFPKTQWVNFSIGSRLRVGRAFFKVITEGEWKRDFKFLGKVGGTREARYLRRNNNGKSANKS